MEEDDNYDEEDIYSSDHESFKTEENDLIKMKTEDLKEDSTRKKERELIENNLKGYPFFRGIMAEVNVHSR